MEKTPDVSCAATPDTWSHTAYSTAWRKAHRGGWHPGWSLTSGKLPQMPEVSVGWGASLLLSVKDEKTHKAKGWSSRKAIQGQEGWKHVCNTEHNRLLWKELCAQSLRRARLFVTLQTVARQLLCPWDPPGKNTGVGCHSLLQGIFLNQGLNPRLLFWQVDSLALSHLGSLERSYFSTNNRLLALDTGLGKGDNCLLGSCGWSALGAGCLRRGLTQRHLVTTELFMAAKRGHSVLNTGDCEHKLPHLWGKAWCVTQSLNTETSCPLRGNMSW